MKIGDLARTTGVSVRLLRYYEEQGLLASHRTSGGHRQYAADAPATVTRIRTLLAAGLPTRTIRDLMPCFVGDGPELDACVLDHLRAQLDALDGRMAELQRARTSLGELLAASLRASTPSPPEARAPGAAGAPRSLQGRVALMDLHEPAPAPPDPPTLRPITGPDELDLFRRLPYLLDDELAGDLAEGRRRPEWMWVALAGGRLLARAAWWSRPGDASPVTLDVLDVDDTLPAADRVDIGVRLLRTAMSAVLPAGAVPPEYGRYVPPGWREDPGTRAAVEDRMAVAGRTGARLFVERLRMEWRPGAPVPAPGGRLAFRPPHDDAEVLALMTAALDGTLDAHSRDDLRRMSAEAAARLHFDDELARYASPRDWWRVAVLPGGGEPVGFVLPAHNGYNATIAYLAVLPAHRGKGYADDVLAEGTRVLAGQDVPRIRAATDVGNAPMAAAFDRAGYTAFGGQITMVWDA